ARAGPGTTASLIQLATHPDPGWGAELLNELPKGASLEGFLFPDTYQLPSGLPKPSDLIVRMLDDFQKRVAPDVRQQMQAQKHSLYETVTVASIVEREARGPADRPPIAGVCWHRLPQGACWF